MPRSILLIDDEPEVISLLSRYFERQGWEVHAAESGEAGLQAHERYAPDVVLLDLNLPGIYGLQVLEVLVSRGATTILFSGDSDLSTAVEAMRIGAENFLPKPVDLGHLGAAVERALEKVALRRTNELLARSLADGHQFAGLGTSPPMRRLARQLELLAASEATTVLLLGESGTGKGWVSQLLHAHSPRARGPFVEINCAGLSATFLDSELFGHEKGAFTDAKNSKRGLFEVADGGTLFLDEIGDLAPDLQPKLLRVLERKSFRRLGGTKEIQVDVRLIAATNRDLDAEVRAGRFREDLYYRLAVLPLKLPPLRERSRDDVLALVHTVLRRLAADNPAAPATLSPRALELMLNYPWPGNVRELRNALERARVLALGAPQLLPEHLPPEVARATVPAVSANGFVLRTMDEVERLHLEGALVALSGNRTRVAEALGISRATLHNKIRLYGLEELGRA